MKYNEITIPKWLFKNAKYNQEQNVKRWKQQHHDKVIDYHKQYNANRDNYVKYHGWCDVCNHDYFDLFAHNNTQKHYKNMQKQI